MTDFNELAERVEAGEAFSHNFRNIFDEQSSRNAHEALKGSLDAAKALHDAVLPGWGWHIREDGDGCYASCLYPKHNLVTPGSATAKTPAAAWVAAILRAKAANP